MYLSGLKGRKGQAVLIRTGVWDSKFIGYYKGLITGLRKGYDPGQIKVLNKGPNRVIIEKKGLNRVNNQAVMEQILW